MGNPELQDIKEKAKAAENRVLKGWGAILTALSGRVPVPVAILVISVVVGTAAGACAELLKYILKWLWDVLSHDISPGHALNWRLLTMPLSGILMAMIFQRYILHRDLSCGTAKVLKLVHRPDGDYKIAASTSLTSILGCGMTVGFGASAGAEGPMAMSGAALGSGFGRLCGMQPQQVRMLVAIGAGAGIAGIFKAPVGGMLYALEVLEMQFSTISMMALVLACVMASTTAVMISGTPFDVVFKMNFPDNSNLGWIALLGIFIGAYGLWYVWTRKHTTRILGLIANPWYKALLSGALMSACVFLVPALFGEGSDVMIALMDGEYPAIFRQGIFAADAGTGRMFFLALIFMLLFKGVLVAAANNGGGVAGEMVPAMFIGGIAGCLFGSSLNVLFHLDIPVWYMSLAGMGAMLGCSTHAPLMSVFIMAEMTNSLQYLPAYLICCMVSYVFMKLINSKSTWSNTGHDDLLSLRRLRGVSNAGSTTPDQTPR